MGFKARRAKQPEPEAATKSTGEFEHSSGATDLEDLLGEHTLDADAEPTVPKGYRARSVKSSGASKNTGAPARRNAS